MPARALVFVAIVLLCRPARAQEGALVDDVASWAAQALTAFESALTDPARGELARQVGVTCIAKVQAALDGGVPASTIIEVPVPPRPKLPLDEVIQKICQPALQATFRGVMRALAGDKAALYRDRWRDLPVRGRGGKVLVTPRELARADRWCSVTVEREAGRPRWQLFCIRFKGQQQLGAPIHRSGPGERPPASAF